jgi:hypothetical protein
MKVRAKRRLCETCRRPVKRRGCRWCSPTCVPSSARAIWAQASRRMFSYRRRVTFFRAELNRLQGQTVTRDELYALLDRVERRGYQRGYHAADEKWRRLTDGRRSA